MNGSETPDGLDQWDQDPEGQAQSDEVETWVNGGGGRGDSEADQREQQEDEVEDGHGPTVPAPVDGYTVQVDGSSVSLILSDRYGEGEEYTLDPESASRIGHALIAGAVVASGADDPG